MRIPRPSGWAILAQRDYRRIWLAHTGSVMGDTLHSLALVWLVFNTLSGGPQALAVLAFANLLPNLLLGIVSGTLVDRLDRRRVMIAADLVRAALVGLLALLVWRGTADIALVVVVSAVLTTAATFFGPARSALMPTYVARDHLVAASALIQTSLQAAQLIGPAIGGVLFVVLGPAGLLTLDAASFLWSALLLTGLSHRPSLPGSPRRRPLYQEAGDGLRFIAGHAPSRLVIAIAAGNQLFATGPFRLLVPAWIASVLGGGAGQYGALMSALAAGLLSANVIMSTIKARLPLVRLIVAGVFFDGLFFLLFALSPTLIIAAGCFFALGVANAILNAANAARLQLTVPTQLRGRTFATFSTVMNLTAPVSLALTSVLVTTMSPAAIIALSGLGLMVVGLVGGAAAARAVGEPDAATAE